MDPNYQMSLAGPLNIESDPMDTSQSEMGLSRSSALNVTVGSLTTDLHSWDCTTAMEHEGGQNGDDESEDETFARLDNRTYQCKCCPEIYRHLQDIRKHTKMQHPSEWKKIVKKGMLHDRRVHFHSLAHSFECTECDQEHRKVAEADQKAEVNSTSKPLEDGVKENGQMNDQNADGELISIVIKEEAIFQIENASAAGVSATTGIFDNSFNTNQPSEKGMMLEIKQEPLDYGEPANSTVLIEEEKSTDTEGTSEQKSAEIENRKVDFVEAEKDFHESSSEQSEPSVEQQVVSTESDAEEKPVFLLTEERKQKDQMDVDESIDAAETPPRRGNQSCICEDCGVFFDRRRGLEKHRKQYHSPTSTQVLKIINCPYCQKLFTTVSSWKSHIAAKHVRSEFKVNCGHCPVHVRHSVQLKKHYKMVHPEERVTFMCPECKKLYLNHRTFKDHYRKHRKEAGSTDQADMNSTSEPVEDGMSDAEGTTEKQKQEEQMELDEIVKKFAAETAVQCDNKSFKCKDCGLNIRYRRRFEEHRMRYHSPTSTQVLKILNCPYCPQLLTSPANRTHHIAIHHVQSEIKVNCAHCPVQVTDTVLLRKHYNTVHPEERVTFKCPECEKVLRSRSYFRDHYKKHRKEAQAGDQAERKNTCEPVEDGMKENDRNADGELVSIVIKEEAIVQIGDAAAPGVNGSERPAGPGKAIEHRIGSDGRVSDGNGSDSNILNMTVGSMPKGLQSERDNSTVTEHEDDQNGDDKSENDTFYRLDNRTYQCKFCPEIFRLIREIQKHTKVQHASEWKTFRCMHCKHRFPTVPMRDRHVHFHSLNHPFKCTECDQMYRSKKNLEKHFQAFHDRNSDKFSMERFHCGSCELTFVEKKYYDLHSTIYHAKIPKRLKSLSDKIQLCERCVQTFDSRVSLMEHIRQTHQDDPPLKNCICKTCSKDLKTVTLLRTHILVVHFGIMPFACPHCKVEFTTRYWLLKHIEKDHSEVDLFKCPFCDESFTTESRMTEHKDKVHAQLEIESNSQTGKAVYAGGKCESEDLLHKQLVKVHPSYTLIYKCPLCPQSVRYRKQHMRVHHVVEYDAKKHHYLVSYMCHCCSKLFQQKRTLLEHQNALSNQCGQCQMRFSTKRRLQSHMAIHRDNKSFKCEDCGLDCGYRARLDEHRMRYHSPTSTQVLKIINCPHCPKMFTNPSNWARHIAVNHVQSEFKVNCGHCSVQETDTVLLRKHYKVIHPEERVTFKCPECERVYLDRTGFKNHYRKHGKEA